MTDYEYEKVANTLDEEIKAGRYRPGEMLPSVRDLMARFGVSKTTMDAVTRELTARGRIRAERGRGTMVLDPRGEQPVRIHVNQHSAVPAADDTMDPWEIACAEQGRAGSVVTISVLESQARDDVAERLQLSAPHDRVIRRFRHARLDGRPAQVQAALYPSSRFGGTAFAEEHRLSTSTYAAMRELGLNPVSFGDAVSARGATPEEAADLRIRPGSPVLVIERITRDADGTPLELLRIVADPLRTELAYDDLRIARP